MAIDRAYVFVNGKFMRKDEACLSVYDHGFLYGDGVYEALRVYEGVVFKLREHLDRLYESAKSVKLNLPVNKNELGKIVIELLKRNELRTAYVRIVCSRGAGKLGIDPRYCTEPTIVVIAEPTVPPFATKPGGISTIISSVRRTPCWAMDPRIKTLSYMNNLLAKIEAIEAGVDEAIMLNEQGYVAESSIENIFVVKNDVVITAHPNLGVLKGITRDTVIEIAKELGYTVEERGITVHELFNADEVFLTGTAAELVPVTTVSGRAIRDGTVGPVSTKIANRFQEVRTSPSQGTVIE